MKPPHVEASDATAGMYVIMLIDRKKENTSRYKALTSSTPEKNLSSSKKMLGE